MSDSNSLSVSWLICELRLLDRLLYKQRNQHHKGNYFHKLVAVKHQTRQLLQLVQAYQQQAKQTISSKSTAVSTLHRSPSLSQLKLSEDCFQFIIGDRRTGPSLQSRQEIAQHVVHCQHAIIKASAVLYALLSQTYFMSFALTALAIIARMYSSQRTLLAQLLDACAAQVRSNMAQKQKKKNKSDSTVDNSSQPSTLDPTHMLADSLLRAMRSDCEREWIERCDGAQLFLPLNKLPCANAARDACLQLQLGPQSNLTNDPQSVSRLLSHSKHAIASEEGDSDEDEDADQMDESDEDDEEEGNIIVAASTPKNPSKSAALPSALSFFSPAASLKQTTAAAGAKTKTNTPAGSSSSTAFQTPAKTDNSSKITRKMEVRDDENDEDARSVSGDEEENEDDSEQDDEDESADDDDDNDEEDDETPYFVVPSSKQLQSSAAPRLSSSSNPSSSSALKKSMLQKQTSPAPPHTNQNIGQKRKDAPSISSSSPKPSPSPSPSVQQQQQSKQHGPQSQQQQPPLKKAKLSPAMISPAPLKKLPSPSPQLPVMMQTKPPPSTLKKNATTLNPLAVLTGASQKAKSPVANSGLAGNDKQLIKKKKKPAKSDIDEMDDIFG